ncbi:MAG TPA: hypothetical protein VHW44_16075 [Pseudonocardiaceae bacterium]|jgi:hypothetical protein|nr:hypothetical protein [Pseudonocardiaceae bacterium]
MRTSTPRDIIWNAAATSESVSVRDIIWRHRDIIWTASASASDIIWH